MPSSSIGLSLSNIAKEWWASAAVPAARSAALAIVAASCRLMLFPLLAKPTAHAALQQRREDVWNANAVGAEKKRRRMRARCLPVARLLPIAVYGDAGPSRRGAAIGRQEYNAYAMTINPRIARGRRGAFRPPRSSTSGTPSA